MHTQCSATLYDPINTEAAIAADRTGVGIHRLIVLSIPKGTATSAASPDQGVASRAGKELLVKARDINVAHSTGGYRNTTCKGKRMADAINRKASISILNQNFPHSSALARAETRVPALRSLRTPRSQAGGPWRDTTVTVEEASWVQDVLLHRPIASRASGAPCFRSTRCSGS